MSDAASSRPPAVARALGLEPHPEGGWFRQTFASDVEVTVERDGVPTARRASTLIEFFLPAGEASAWHVVASPEVWIWQMGAVTLELGGDGARPSSDPETIVLGDDYDAGQVPQMTVPAGVWQRTVPSDEDALVACLVSPGFEFEDFRLAD